MRDLDRPWKRLKAADYTINVEVGNGDVVRAFDFKGQSEPTFAALFFSLQRVNPPVRNVVQLNLIPNMMLARQFVNAPLGGGIGYQHPGLGEGAGRPDVEERTTTAVGNPQTGILPIPAPVQVGIGGVAVVIRVLTRSINFSRAVSAKKADVVHQRIFA